MVNFKFILQIVINLTFFKTFHFYLFSTNYYFRLKESLITEFDLEITNGKAICIPIGTNKYCYSC